mmetsp:Transcript_7619/g.14180  ORF Transcript_7619/g.14180 Transcript_7619/m.14180 type:complete len:360 (-) Transcript_7619:14-1093(-)
MDCFQGIHTCFNRDQNTVGDECPKHPPTRQFPGTAVTPLMSPPLTPPAVSAQRLDESTERAARQPFTLEQRHLRAQELQAQITALVSELAALKETKCFGNDQPTEEAGDCGNAISAPNMRACAPSIEGPRNSLVPMPAALCTLGARHAEPGDANSGSKSGELSEVEFEQPLQDLEHVLEQLMATRAVVSDHLDMPLQGDRHPDDVMEDALKNLQCIHDHLLTSGVRVGVAPNEAEGQAVVSEHELVIGSQRDCTTALAASVIKPGDVAVVPGNCVSTAPMDDVEMDADVPTVISVESVPSVPLPVQRSHDAMSEAMPSHNPEQEQCPPRLLTPTQLSAMPYAGWARHLTPPKTREPVMN